MSGIHFEYFLEDLQAFGQYYDIAHIMAEKVSFEIGDRIREYREKSGKSATFANT